MTNQEIINQATAEIKAVTGYHFIPEVLAEVVESGLQDGDKINVGGSSYITLEGDTAIMSQKNNGEEKEVRRMNRADLNQEMLDTLLKCKAKTAAVAATRK